MGNQEHPKRGGIIPGAGLQAEPVDAEYGEVINPGKSARFS